MTDDQPELWPFNCLVCGVFLHEKRQMRKFITQRVLGVRASFVSEWLCLSCNVPKSYYDKMVMEQVVINGKKKMRVRVKDG